MTGAAEAALYLFNYSRRAPRRPGVRISESLRAHHISMTYVAHFLTTVLLKVFGHKHTPHNHADAPMIPVQVWGQQSMYAGTSSTATMTLFTPKR